MGNLQTQVIDGDAAAPWNLRWEVTPARRAPRAGRRVEAPRGGHRVEVPRAGRRVQGTEWRPRMEALRAGRHVEAPRGGAACRAPRAGLVWLCCSQCQGHGEGCEHVTKEADDLKCH